MFTHILHKLPTKCFIISYLEEFYIQLNKNGGRVVEWGVPPPRAAAPTLVYWSAAPVPPPPLRAFTQPTTTRIFNGKKSPLTLRNVSQWRRCFHSQNPPGVPTGELEGFLGVSGIWEKGEGVFKGFLGI